MNHNAIRQVDAAPQCEFALLLSGSILQDTKKLSLSVVCAQKQPCETSSASFWPSGTAGYNLSGAQVLYPMHKRRPRIIAWVVGSVCAVLISDADGCCMSEALHQTVLQTFTGHNEQTPTVLKRSACHLHPSATPDLKRALVHVRLELLAHTRS